MAFRTYEDACEATVSQVEAAAEVAKHDDADFSEFLEDVGDKLEYTGKEILDWLGY
jgi:hypothetical protein